MMKLEDLKASAPQAEAYLDLAGKSITSATMAFDYARAAEKMVDPNCAGPTNPAWQKGPIISSAPGLQPINRNAPSILQGSIESAVAGHIVHGESQEDDAIHLPQADDIHNQVEHIIAKLAIIEQCVLLNDFLGAIATWKDKASQETIATIGQINARFHELLNDPTCETADMREAVDIFCAATQCAAEVSQNSM